MVPGENSLPDLLLVEQHCSSLAGNLAYLLEWNQLICVSQGCSSKHPRHCKCAPYTSVLLVHGYLIPPAPSTDLSLLACQICSRRWAMGSPFTPCTVLVMPLLFAATTREIFTHKSDTHIDSTPQCIL